MFNTEDIYDAVGSMLLQRRGLRFGQELKMKMMGLPGKVAIAVMKDECGLAESVAELESESNAIFRDLLPDRIEMMPGLETLLLELERRQLPKAVATSSHRPFAEKALNTFGLLARFSFVLTSDDVKNGKPAPDIYQLAGARLNVPTQRLLVLEDSVIGSTAATIAGALTIAIPGRHSAGQDFSHVDHVVDRLDSDVILGLLPPDGG